MKKITTYVNNNRVNWFIEELQSKGINEIMVSECFSPISQILKLEFSCNEDHVEELRRLIHTIGSGGKSADYLFFVKDADSRESIFTFIY